MYVSCGVSGVVWCGVHVWCACVVSVVWCGVPTRPHHTAPWGLVQCSGVVWCGVVLYFVEGEAVTLISVTQDQFNEVYFVSYKFTQI